MAIETPREVETQRAVETPQAAEPLRWQFTVADFTRMAGAGILSEDDRVELINGEVRAMSPVGPTHGAVINRLTMLLAPRLVGKAIVSIQNPVQLDDFSEPLPDVVVARLRDDYYALAHPSPDDVLLLIEVADSSLPYDRGEKRTRYAQAGIPEYWVIDIPRRRVFQYVAPGATGYRTERVLSAGDAITCAFGLDITLSVDEIF